MTLRAARQLTSAAATLSATFGTAIRANVANVALPLIILDTGGHVALMESLAFTLGGKRLVRWAICPGAFSRCTRLNAAPLIRQEPRPRTPRRFG